MDDGKEGGSADGKEGGSADGKEGMLMGRREKGWREGEGKEGGGGLWGDENDHCTYRIIQHKLIFAGLVIGLVVVVLIIIAIVVVVKFKVLDNVPTDPTPATQSTSGR